MSELLVNTIKKADGTGSLSVPAESGTVVVKDGSNNVTLNDITATGVYLGGTGAANYLDDYEEGTWTPFWSSGVTSPTYLVQQGRYVKIGKQVIASCYLRSGTGTGNASHINIGGLPFTCSNDATGVDGAFWSYNAGFYNSTTGSSWLVNQNTTLCLFYRQSDGGSIAGNASGVTVNSDVRIVMVYRTDA